MIQQRNIVTSIILSIVTCGLYAYYWQYKLTDEVKSLTGDTESPSGGMAVLLSIVTCGIYLFIWMFKMGNNLDSLYASKGQPASNRGIIYLVLTFCGLGIVSLALMQDSVNKAI